jgi:hypothetical protein
MLSFIIVSFLATAAAMPIDFGQEALLQTSAECVAGNQYKLVTDSCRDWMDYANDGVVRARRRFVPVSQPGT